MVDQGVPANASHDVPSYQKHVGWECSSETHSQMDFENWFESDQCLNRFPQMCGKTWAWCGYCRWLLLGQVKTLLSTNGRPPTSSVIQSGCCSFTNAGIGDGGGVVRQTKYKRERYWFVRGCCRRQGTLVTDERNTKQITIELTKLKLN